LFGFALAWTDSSLGTGLAWAALYGLLTCLLPLGVVVYLFKKGRISDLHMRHQGERHLPYLLGVVCAALVFVLISALDGPRLLQALSLCNIIGLGTLGLINVYWLISNHTASIMLVVTFAGFAFGIGASMLLLPLIGLTLWARLLLRRHTVAQLFGGLLIGAAPVLILAHLGYIY
jgi:hypothetical protein